MVNVADYSHTNLGKIEIAPEVLSVIASKLDNCKKKYVKCNNTHARNFKHIYWYPNTINLQNFIDI
jgi:hypothetical protein